MDSDFQVRVIFSAALAALLFACGTSAAVDIATTQNVLQAVPPELAVSMRDADSKHLPHCPNMVHYVFEDAAPHDEAKAGIFEKFVPESGDSVDMVSCLNACCMKTNNTCNVVFIFKRNCYHVRCVSNEACLPKQRMEMKNRVQMVLVNPVRQEGTEDENVTWLDVLKASKDSSDLARLEELSAVNSKRVNFWKQPPHKFRYLSRNQEGPTYDDEDFPIPEKRVEQQLLDSANEGDGLTANDIAFYNANQASEGNADDKYMVCDFDISEMRTQCPPKEVCMPVQANPGTGICKCRQGYTRNQLRECVELDDYPFFGDNGNTRHDIIPVSASDSLPIVLQTQAEKQTPMHTESSKKLTVSVVSKEVRLPEKEVSLAAFTVPDEQSSGSKYKYLWTLITQPKGPMNGTISDQSNSKVKLSNLSEGLYTFKVSVTGDSGTHGEAMANVTVLPEKRINRAPQVVITPANQTIRQPTTNAILDGSSSSDDDKILSWHWEVVSGPIGYQPKLEDVNTLQLTDLTSPGNYTFKLTVTDSDNMTNSTTANITVLKGTDYPPVANAGDAVVLYLPNNNVTLNGTASSDDHEIAAWEWTKDTSDEAKAVDMQHTRTPYVQLSNLEEGMYTFVLKVTDGSGQSSTAKVQVLVKPQTNSPPVAVAGGNVTINLPQNWATLNGSQSSDDIGIKSFNWEQVIGPKPALILKANATIANATALTLGLYEFRLNVTDENNNTATASTWVKVVQEKNAAPIANAGGDQTLTLPVTAIYFNGSGSWDDLAITKYVWTRDETSLAAGNILGDTDKEPVLILTDLVHGRYVFKLTVSDEQGLSSTDTVSVNVRPDPVLKSLVQMTLPMGISVLSHGELTTIVQKIGLLLGDMKVKVRELKYDVKSEATILIFYVEITDADGKPNLVNGLKVEQLLKDKLQRDVSILGAMYVDVRTTVCQNNCSRHGVCNQETRACICEAFWMPSAGYFWGLVEANCDWSILYVFVAIIVIFLLLSALFWSIACACKRQTKKPRSSSKKYSKLKQQDEETPQFRATSLSDSETDSDVLFETRTKSNGILRINGVTARNKHNQTRIGRKIKT